VRLFGILVTAVLVVAGWDVVGRGFGGPAPSTSSRAPAAVGDVLTKTTTVGPGIQAAAPDAEMAARTSGVRLLRYGTVPTYGAGAEERSSAPGRHLVAFEAEPIAGESGTAMPMLSVRIDGVERGPLVITTEYVVASVPDGATAVDLVLTEGTLKQSISLLTGRPAASNLEVCIRRHRTVELNASRPVTVRVSTAKGTLGLTSGVLTVRTASLSYWADDGSRSSEPSRALLHVEAVVRLSGDREPYGAEAALLTVRVLGAPPVIAHNAAANAATSVDDVVEVPAATTGGTISYSGTLHTAAGTLSVVTPVTVPFAIPAG
jgi:hypothetical protein